MSPELLATIKGVQGFPTKWGSNAVMPVSAWWDVAHTTQKTFPAFSLRVA
jgi:hypothetical protein